MNPSRLGTISVPAIATASPSGFVTAPRNKDGGRPVRVEIHNTGGAVIRLAFESASLGTTSSDGVDHFQLVVGGTVTIIVAPSQTLYCVAVGAGGGLSYVASEAIPFSSEAG